MPVRTHRTIVKVPAGPWDASTPPSSYRDEPALGFNFEAPNYDVARDLARDRIEKNGYDVRSVSHGPGDTLVVLAHPKAPAAAPTIARPVRR